MKSWTALTAVFAATLLLSGGPAFAKEKKMSKADCDQTQPSASVAAHAPQRIEGEIAKVDTASGMVTVRASDGAMHEFHAHPDDLKTFKVGERLEANLRPGC